MTLIEIMSDVNAEPEIGGEKHLPHFERVMIVNVSGVVAAGGARLFVMSFATGCRRQYVLTGYSETACP